ncbi:hypothetical protein EMCRGX_G016781 [Ephydatia muelleri]
MHIKPASNLVLLMLKDVLVHCTICTRDMRAAMYEHHECTPSLTHEDQRSAAKLIKRISPEKGAFQLPTGGTPITFHNPTTTVCTRSLKSRCSELQDIRRIVSGGEPSALLQSEVLSLSDEERKSLLKEAGISDEIKIGPVEVLAIKVGLAIPWNKIRLLRRWLKASNVSLACEERMRHVGSKRIVGDNIQGELAPFSFTLTSGGEELRAAPLVFIPNLIQKVTQLLDENHRTSRLTWHNGVIPENEVWLKLGGDKAGDSFANLHIALDRYKEKCITSNEITCRQYTLKVFLSGDYEILSKFYGLSGAHPCPFCLIANAEMATPLIERGHAPPRTLDGIEEQYLFHLVSGSVYTETGTALLQLHF